jgi:hypothetical protein
MEELKISIETEQIIRKVFAKGYENVFIVPKILRTDGLTHREHILLQETNFSNM